LRRILHLARPFGIALAIFILLNLVLAIQKPSLSANRIWLYLQIPEPLLSAIAGILGMALLVPHAQAARPGLRLLLSGILVGFLALVCANIHGFYQALLSGKVGEALPVPFSLLIAVILALEAGRLIWWAPFEPRLPLPASRFLSGLGIVVAFFVLILAHIITFGMTDYTPAARAVDAAVILGAKVYPDGTLSHALEDRLFTGVDLYNKKKVKFLILSGGIEPGGINEPEAMAKYAMDRHVPVDRLILDTKGNNTYASAKNCGRLAREMGFKKLLVVSQYFHNARVKLIFEREGTPCYTVPARRRVFLREGYFLFREAIAFPYYFLFYR